MGKKRREDSDHDIGDSSPRTVGDKQTEHSKETPMDRIHKRRNSDVSVPEPTDGKKPNDDHAEKGEDGSDKFGIPVQFKDSSNDDGESE
jgi:hypothetical protein